MSALSVTLATPPPLDKSRGTFWPLSVLFKFCGGVSGIYGDECCGVGNSDMMVSHISWTSLMGVCPTSFRVCTLHGWMSFMSLR